ncbi:hypothetical protein DT070_12460 [Polaromonas sp. SP1]|nr:hypothetical protein DT070_12460 [Polaromonas sp. SP1]
MQHPKVSRFLYTAWFQDALVEPDDEDFEWPACFLVTASSMEAAQHWGDHLSDSFSRRRESERFLRSSVEIATASTQDLPVVVDGYEATDGEIGW